MSNHAGRWVALLLTAFMIISGGSFGWLPNTAQAADRILYVKEGAAGDGSSWADAFGNLQDALDVASASGGTVDQIWVAAGVYKPTKRIDAAEERSRAFQLINGVAVYGGFPAEGNPTWSDRDWETNATILSGDFEDDDDPEDVDTYKDNAYHVFFHHPDILAEQLDHTAVLDGVTITGGNAEVGAGDSWTNPHSNGGGMYNYASSPTLINVTFEGNRAYSDGAGMYNQGANGDIIDDDVVCDIVNDHETSPLLRNVTFKDNVAEYGGGLSNLCSSPSLEDVTFTHNTAGDEGGAVFNWFSNPSFVDVMIGDNTSDFSGGGVANWESAPTFHHVQIVRNTSGLGGGMYNDESNIALVDVQIIENSATNGGGLYNNSDSNAILTNVRVAENSAALGGGIYNEESSLSLINSEVIGNLAFLIADRLGYGGGIYDEGGETTLVNVLLGHNIARSEGGGLYGEYSKHTLVNVTISGNYALSDGGGVSFVDDCLECEVEKRKVQIQNSIIWGNFSANEDDPAGDPAPNNISLWDAVPLISHSLIQDSFGSGEDWDDSFGTDAGNNIDADPLFERPFTEKDVPGTEGNYRLKAGSPAIHAGHNGFVPNDVHTDLDGNSRFSGTVDMGAYEYQTPASRGRSRTVTHLSDNANLEALLVLQGNKSLSLIPDFLPGEASYRTETYEDQVIIQAVPEDMEARVTLSGTLLGTDGIEVDLEVGENVFDILVRAENGAAKTYTLTIHRLTQSSDPQKKFDDIVGHWAENEINEALQQGWVEGFPDATFRPDETITRAQFATMLARSLHFTGHNTGAPSFSDQSSIPAWARDAIAHAVQAGIIHGYADGSFRPSTPVLRSEMATMVARAANLPLNQTESTSFADDANIPDWAKPYLAAVVEAGLMNGQGNNMFAPNAQTTRAEATVLILRLVNFFNS